MATIPYNYDRVCQAGVGHVMPDPFRTDRDTGQAPDDTVLLFNVEHGAQVEDRAGQRFRVLDAGPMQGTVTLRDRYRRVFFAEGNQCVRTTGA